MTSNLDFSVPVRSLLLLPFHVFSSTRLRRSRSQDFSGFPPNLAFADDLVHEKERYKAISEELDATFAELSGY
ncbi:hypothetical protein L596_007346 [Steinernema carpocapsae]|uniref:Uncharacterized protein n=1 Tax=Steinernema carpocapsae TaxID=34508 RepID=A0A4U5P9P8_STECR|nr:hypothetical protein L596_007346 [Steinernema carpocapsae]